MTPYPSSGSFTTESREVAVSETWDAWSNPQASSNVEVVSGALQLEEVDVVVPDDAVAVYDFSQEDGTLPVTDQTGNGNDLDTGGYTSVSVAINGVQAGEFDGSDDSVNGSFVSSYSQPYTIIVVIEGVDNGSMNRVTHASPNLGGILDVRYNNDDYRMYAGSSVAGGTPGTNPVIVTGYFDGGTSELRVNGSQVASGDPGGDGVGGLTVGSEDGGGNYFGGSIGQVEVYDGEPNQGLSSRESDLGAKWGISV